MSGGVGRNSRPAFDRSLIPRVKSYLKENSHIELTLIQGKWLIYFRENIQTIWKKEENSI
jgi:hypothetical protein